LFAQTHQIVSLHIRDAIQKNHNYSLNRSTFAWGNMKPDIAPSLAVRKHYKAETFDFVIDKIVSLMQLSPLLLLDRKQKKAIECEIGVVCHFLSDFFCVPHNQRWEFKTMMIPHVRYEGILHTKVKGISVVGCIAMPGLCGHRRTDIVDFLETLLSEYESEKDYQRDLVYSVNVCTKITAYILESILANKQAAILTA
jgi:hypothetical protein